MITVSSALDFLFSVRYEAVLLCLATIVWQRMVIIPSNLARQRPFLGAIHKLLDLRGSSYQEAASRTLRGFREIRFASLHSNQDLAFLIYSR